MNNRNDMNNLNDVANAIVGLSVVIFVFLIVWAIGSAVIWGILLPITGSHGPGLVLSFVWLYFLLKLIR